MFADGMWHRSRNALHSANHSMASFLWSRCMSAFTWRSVKWEIWQFISLEYGEHPGWTSTSTSTLYLYRKITVCHPRWEDDMKTTYKDNYCQDLGHTHKNLLSFQRWEIKKHHKMTLHRALHANGTCRKVVRNIGNCDRRATVYN